MHRSGQQLKVPIPVTGGCATTTRRSRMSKINKTDSTVIAAVMVNEDMISEKWDQIKDHVRLIHQHKTVNAESAWITVVIEITNAEYAYIQNHGPVGKAAPNLLCDTPDADVSSINVRTVDDKVLRVAVLNSDVNKNIIGITVENPLPEEYEHLGF